MDKIDKAVWSCIKEMYTCADPSVDVGDSPEELLRVIPTAKRGEDPDWYEAYYLPREQYDDILDKHVKACRFRGYNKKRFIKMLHFTAMDIGPASIRRTNHV